MFDVNVPFSPFKRNKCLFHNEEQQQQEGKEEKNKPNNSN